MGGGGVCRGGWTDHSFLILVNTVQANSDRSKVLEFLLQILKKELMLWLNVRKIKKFFFYENNFLIRQKVQNYERNNNNSIHIIMI